MNEDEPPATREAGSDPAAPDPGPDTASPDGMSPAAFLGWCRSMGFGPDQAAAALGCGRNRVEDYGREGTRIPRFVQLACDWIEARRGMKNLHGAIAARMKTPMSGPGFRVWCAAIGADPARPWLLATLLGVRTSKVRAWLEGRAEVPWTVRLACLRLGDRAKPKA
ncbi:MAG: hypothetical protein WCO00_03930 [Rhodospirillaceae bacterium]